MIQVSDPSQKIKIRLMKKALLIGTVWGIAVIILLYGILEK